MKIEDIQQALPLIDSRSLVDKVELNLMNLFKNSDLKPGDSIPREADLAEAMGVSRTVIRESLNRLKTVGLIETRKKKGTVIKSPDLSILLKKTIIPEVLNESTLRDAFELRMILEIGMADSIFRYLKPEDIAELEKITLNEPESTENILFDIDHEVQFHGKLYAITGNLTLISFQSLLMPVFNYVYSSGLINVEVNKKKHISHKGLIEVLKNGGPAEFREAMRDHLENHYTRLFGPSGR